MIKVNLICIITILLGISGNANAQNDMLDKKQEKIITISALTAKGDLERLKPELVAGLEAGLTVNEIKEGLVHLYAYCGFPRSIRGLQTFMTVLMSVKPMVLMTIRDGKHRRLMKKAVSTNVEKRFWAN